MFSLGIGGLDRGVGVGCFMVFVKWMVGWLGRVELY